MSPAAAVVFVCALLLAALLLLRRANELFRIVVDDGRAEHVSGRVPPALFHDIQDVIARSKVSRAVLRVVSESGRPRLLAHDGLNPTVLQQLRNVIGRFNVTQIRNGRRARR